MVVYMVVGHTKFGPDHVARQIAGRYHSRDTFNHGQLVDHISKYATACAYDETMLQTWKMGTQELFAPIVRIMSYRCFVVLADDGNVRLDLVAPPADFDPFPDGGSLFHDADLMRECEKAAQRRLRTVVFPTLRRWMRCPSLEAVNAALASVHQYAAHPQMRKEADGSKAKDIADQYAKYVPPEFVPDRFSIPEAGCTGTLTQTTLSRPNVPSAARPSTHTSGNVAALGATPVTEEPAPKAGKVRWSAAAHAKPLLSALLSPPFNGVLPKKLPGWRTLVDKMPDPEEGLVWDVQTLKRHAKLLAKARPGISL
ncbi:hypothetical protein I4F81_009699 [Pyropia yezoensis]|uniref:Uncharacterized protein n=1 Tax=Pyropia yezoensis TaxID=2788 RepID=A0ACC3CBM5_PYRYE|nr:hypothetical protein I4F81_009699 [Neopyropia yezoensis]